MKPINIIIFLLLAAFCSQAQVPVPNVAPKLQQASVNIGLAFDPSPSVGVTKYVLRRGDTNGTYLEMVELPATQTTYTWPNANAFKSSFFVVSAKNTAGEESTYSNEVEWRPASARLDPPKMKTVERITAKFRITPPQTIEHVNADNEVQSKLRIFIDDGKGSQNLMLTTTDGDFRIAEGPKIPALHSQLPSSQLPRP